MKQEQPPKKMPMGLANIGATCYMNSLLQCLYMTVPFRQLIYQWRYNPKLHVNKENSIIYQMQKLFAKLQLGTKYSGNMQHQNNTAILIPTPDTKELVRSFQWQDQQAQLQQDIQQFNRVLFQALQKSYATSLGEVMISPTSLFEGDLYHYTKCSVCNTESTRPQSFQDLIIPIKNPYQKTYSSSLQLGLQRYLKPQVLDCDNLYECGVCMAKVKAERGARFIKLPRLLNVILGRFWFDYETMSRKKVNDKMQFPYVLNMNHYMAGYEDIPTKLDEDSSAYFLEQYNGYGYNANKPSSTTSYSKIKSNAIKAQKATAPAIAVAGKIKTKPSANTKSFLQEMRKRKMKEKDQENDDLIFVSGNMPMKQQPKATQSQPKTQSKIKAQQQPKTQSTKMQIQKPIQNNANHIELKQQLPPLPPLPQLPLLLPPPPPPPAISQSFNPTFKVTASQQYLKMQEQLRNKSQIHIGNEYHNATNPNPDNIPKVQTIQPTPDLLPLIENALSDGPNVYYLTSILCHSGTANGGHYFAIIRDEDGRWYRFDDDRVSEVGKQQIEKMYGSASQAVNAYALYYRHHSMFGNKEGLSQIKSDNTSPSCIPQYLQKTILEQAQNHYKRQQLHLQQLTTLIPVKIYYSLMTKTLHLPGSTTFAETHLQALALFSLKTYPHLSRLRAFNPSTDTKLETFGGRQHLTLDQLGITAYRCFTIQERGEEEQWEEYQEGWMGIRVALWEQNQQILNLDENNLQLHKISVRRVSTIAALLQFLITTHGKLFESPPILLKRHQNDTFSYHQLITAEDYLSKTLQELQIFQNQILYAQHANSPTLHWALMFQEEGYKVQIKYVGFNMEEGKILGDLRDTAQQTKNKLCKLLSYKPQETIVRRGNRNGLQLKQLSLSLKENRFINGSSLYLQHGIPSKPGQTRIQLYLSQPTSTSFPNKLHQFEFICDVPINGALKASQVKQVLIPIIKSYKGLSLQINQFRIREKVNDKLGKIYREKSMKEQQLIEKRQIAIQLQPDNLQTKDHQIYIRVWDTLNWTLSMAFPIIVNKTITMKMLAAVIQSHLNQQQSHLNQQQSHLSQQQSQIDAQSLVICRVLSIHKFTMPDLPEMEYHSMNSENSVFMEPMFVNCDGLLYVVKDGQCQVRQPTREEEKQWGRKVIIKPVIRKATNVNRKPKSKEKGVKITVIQKIQQQ